MHERSQLTSHICSTSQISSGYQAVLAPDGLIASLAGPFPGSVPDRAKIKKSRLLATLNAFVPGYKVMGDRGYVFNPLSLLVRSFPGGPFPQGDPRNAYNKRLAQIRVAVEWPMGHVTATFPYVDNWKAMKMSTLPSPEKCRVDHL